MFEMHFYVTITKNKLYHVQNAIMGMMGQHHVHDKEGFEDWKKAGGIEEQYIHISKGQCNCGLKEGQVRNGG